MKNQTDKNTQSISIKKERKDLASEIENSIIGHLVESFEIERKKAEKIVAKSSKKLTKKLAKELQKRKKQEPQSDSIVESLAENLEPLPVS